MNTYVRDVKSTENVQEEKNCNEQPIKILMCHRAMNGALERKIRSLNGDFIMTLCYRNTSIYF